MKAHDPIRYLPQKEIDHSKWDQCISNAGNGLIYGYSFYLTYMAKEWDALVLGDYETIMPLPYNKKYGIYYIYQPAFIASLGVFGNNLTEAIVAQFIQSIPKKFKLVELSLNHGNTIDASAGIALIRNNYTLSLKPVYEKLSGGYKENIRRNIKKSQLAGCIVEKNIPVADIIALSKPAMERLTNIKAEDYVHFEQLYDLLLQKKQVVSYGVYTAAKQLVASCVYFFSHQRAYYILVGNHPDGKTMGASHYLIDRFIHDYAGQDLLLDFEGSDIRNLAYFYSSFGSTVETYPFLRINNLPFFLKWMK